MNPRTSTIAMKLRDSVSLPRSAQALQECTILSRGELQSVRTEFSSRADWKLVPYSRYNTFSSSVWQWFTVWWISVLVVASRKSFGTLRPRVRKLRSTGPPTKICRPTGLLRSYARHCGRVCESRFGAGSLAESGHRSSCRTAGLRSWVEACFCWWWVGYF